MNSIAVRPLDPSEWLAFKKFRLAALQDAPGMFATSYEEAAKRSPETWQATIKGPANQVFGLFDSQRLIGIAGVFDRRDDPSGRTATLVMSFIVPEYRRMGLSRMLYDSRLAWIRAQPQFERVVTALRESNEASRRACQRFGFVAIGRAPRFWPDGAAEDEILYELKLVG